MSDMRYQGLIGSINLPREKDQISPSHFLLPWPLDSLGSILSLPLPLSPVTLVFFRYLVVLG